MTPQFPRVPHFRGSQPGPDDLIMTAAEEATFTADAVALFEKLDGINVAIGYAGGSLFSTEVRGRWPQRSRRQLQRGIGIWVQQHAPQLRRLLRVGDVVYGEWMWQRICIPYDALPDLFIGFALLRHGRFVPILAALDAIRSAGLAVQSSVWRGRLGAVDDLRAFVGRSQHGSRRMEGLVVEKLHPTAGPRIGKWVDARYQRRNKDTLSGDRNRVRIGGARDT